MVFAIRFTDDAERDLEELEAYIALHDSARQAEQVVARIERAVANLAESPERGAHPPELLAFGIRDFREVFFKPYRIVYEVVDDTVTVVLIADGRRDVQSLLQRRLLGAS